MPVSNRKKVELQPYWQSECGRAIVYVGDCLDVMDKMKPDQFHAVVTDPPYGLEFMGKEWDAPWKVSGSVNAREQRPNEMIDPCKAMYLRHNTTYGLSNPHGFQVWFLKRAEAMLRVAKPGAHLLSFGGTRMWHRMACAVEDAGWVIRDTVMWVYGNGFPKSHDVSKAIDKALGAERMEVLGPGTAPLSHGQFNARTAGSGGYRYTAEYDVRAPATEEARQWNGWGTALRPAVEPIVVARKPFVSSVAQNVLEHGCGGVNVNECRIGTTGEVTRLMRSKISSGSGILKYNKGEDGSIAMQGGFFVTHNNGRWPANLIHDGSDEVMELFPMTSTARFFYTAKANDSDRPHGKGKGVIHPTVKPLDLMRYLVRLVCVQGGTVFDPFMGSGSTGCAALAEGMWFVGIEKREEYADIAVGRLRLALESAPLVVQTRPRGAIKDIPPSPMRLR